MVRQPKLFSTLDRYRNVKEIKWKYHIVWLISASG